ncbi:hypothetical protein Z043_109703, partial [Scleropages formosus]
SSLGSSTTAASFQSVGSYGPFSRAPVPPYSQFSPSSLAAQQFGAVGVDAKGWQDYVQYFLLVVHFTSQSGGVVFLSNVAEVYRFFLHLKRRQLMMHVMCSPSGRSSPQLDPLRKSPTLEQAVQAGAPSASLVPPVSVGRRSPAPTRPATIGSQEQRRGEPVGRPWPALRAAAAAAAEATADRAATASLAQSVTKAPGMDAQKVPKADSEQSRSENRDAAGGAQSRRGRGGGHRGRGRFSVRRDGPMKFEKDFDFESANAQFNKEEIDREFHNKLKLKVNFNIHPLSTDDKAEKPEKAVNGEDKGDSGVETQNSEGNADEEDPLGPNCYYDKSKSFFDNISCDDTRKASEKSGASGFQRERRQTWAEERRMNAETFGIPLRRGRGGFRGRGNMGFRGSRGRGANRGSFGPPRGASSSGSAGSFRGGFRGSSRGGREFSDFEYRVTYS